MYQLSILESPPNITFSRNPIIFKFKINPFTQANINNRLRVQVELYMESSGYTGDYKHVWTGFAFPNAQGFAEIDLQSVIDPQLTFFTPPLKYAQLFKCTGQYTGFYIRYFLIDNVDTATTPVSTTATTVAKGGISKEQFQGNSFFTDNIITNKQALHWDNAPNKIRPTEHKWLYFMLPFHTIPVSELSLEVTLYFSGGGSTTYNTQHSYIFVYQGEIMCAPIHLDALDTTGRIPVGQQITSVLIYVFNDGAVVTQYQYDIDHRPILNAQTLYFRNSLGGIETLSILGVKEFNIDVEIQQATQAPIIALLNGEQIQRQQADYWSAHTPSTKANTGFLPLAQIKHLSDMLLSHQVFQILTKRIRPIYINSKQATLYTNTDKLYNLAIEFQHALNDKNYTAENLIAYDDTCPAVDYFNAAQTLGRHVTVEWKIPTGYDQIHVHLDIVGQSPGHDYNFLGNSGTRHIEIPGLAHLNNSEDIIIKARVVCNPVAPGDYGAYTPDASLTIHSEVTAVAMPDVADVGPRALAARELQLDNQILDLLHNDYENNLGAGELEFWKFKDAAGADATTSANGAGLSYNVSTKAVTYSPTPASVANMEEDYFFYQIIENWLPPHGGGRFSNIAKVTVPIAGQIPPIYVQLVRTNERRQQFGYGLFNAYKLDEVIADYYVKFYADAALTTPIDVSGYGITISYNKKITVIEQNSVGVVINTTDSTSGPYSKAASGASMLLIKNHYNRKWNGATHEITDTRPVADPSSGAGNWTPIGW